MKNIVPVLLLAFCIMLSCKRDEHNNPPPATPAGPRYPVQFNVADFKQEIIDLKSDPGAKDDSLANKIHWLYYLVYDSVGNWIHYNIQNADVNGNNFGHLTDSLTPGHYTIIVAGSKSELDINDQYDSPFDSITPRSLSSTYIRFDEAFDGAIEIVDFFAKEIAINVTHDSLQVDITLERKVGMLEINVPDAPFGFNIAPLSEGNYFYPHADTATLDILPFTNPDSYIPLARATKVGPTKWQLLTLNTERPFDVALYLFIGADPMFDRHKIIHNVRCYKNKKTILTGNFYDGLHSVDVSVNDQWDSTNVEITF